MDSDSLPFGVSYQFVFIFLSLFKHGIDINVLWTVILVFILLLLSGIVSGSEIAFFSFDESDIEQLKKSDNKKDAQLLKILANKKKLLSTILISNSTINVAIIILSNSILGNIFNLENVEIFGSSFSLEIIVNIIIVTPFLIFFGENMPKLLASKNNFAFARICYPFIKFFENIFFLLASPLAKFGNFLDGVIEKKKETINLLEIEHAIDLGVDKNTEEKDKKLLKGIVHFGNTMVKQIMKPRVDIFAIDEEENFKTVLNKIKESGYSRIPIFKENIDNIVGVLYIKDLIAHLTETKDFDWQTIIRKTDFVSESKKIDDLLREMQENKFHISIVVDEYGGTEGLVTLEDILEEVVGEINDEFDQFKKKTSKNKDGSYLFEGKTPLLDVCKQVGIEIGAFEGAKGESDTLAGLLLEINGDMPTKGETIIYKDFEFKVIEISKHRIEKINLKIN